MRRNARADANQPEIVKAFRDAGCSVHVTSNLGKGFVDIVVGLGGINVLVEIKDGNSVPSKQKLTPDEVEFHSEWGGWAVVIKSVDEAILLVSDIRSKQTALSKA